MALRTIRLQGDPVLSKVCRPIPEVTPRIRILVEDMVETMLERYSRNHVFDAYSQIVISQLPKDLPYPLKSRH